MGVWPTRQEPEQSSSGGVSGHEMNLPLRAISPGLQLPLLSLGLGDYQLFNFLSKNTVYNSQLVLVLEKTYYDYGRAHFYSLSWK